MSLSDLASLGSFVSGVAVLASLVFLFFQMRQMTEQVKQTERNQRAVLNQGYITRTVENVRWTALSPINELMTRVIAGDTAFTAEELRRLTLAFRSGLLNAQDAYLQHKSGLIDTMTLDNSMLSLRNVWLSRPVFRALWRRQASTISPDFRAVVDSMMQESRIAKPVDLVAQFNADLATVTSAAGQ